MAENKIVSLYSTTVLCFEEELETRTLAHERVETETTVSMTRILILGNQDTPNDNHRIFLNLLGRVSKVAETQRSWNND